MCALLGLSAQAAPATFSQISESKAHGLGLTPDGAVYAWGDNGAGELGQGERGPRRDLPALVRALPGRASAIAAGAKFSVALLEDGTVWAWGAGGPVGADRPAPARVQLPKLALAITAGPSHVVVLLDDGTVAAWGDNSRGALCADAPAKLDAPAVLSDEGVALSEVTEISAGRGSTTLTTLGGAKITCGAHMVIVSDRVASASPRHASKR